MKNKFVLFKHQIFITGICVFALIVSMVGGSYAIFTSQSKANEYNYMQVGDLEVSYVDSGDGLSGFNLDGAFPSTDVDGASQTPFRFYIKNKASGIPADIKVKIAYDDGVLDHTLPINQDRLLDLNYIRVKFDNLEPVTLGDLSASDYTIFSQTNLAAGSSDIHEIRMWIKDDAPNSILGKEFHGKIVLESVQAGIDDKMLKSYSVGDQVTLLDDSKWHVLKNSSKSDATITLISDYNLNSVGEYDTLCETDPCSPIAFDTENLRLSTSNSYCLNDSFGCNMFEKNNDTVNVDSTIKQFIDNVYTPLLKTSLTNAHGYITDLSVSIPSSEDILSADDQTFNQTQLTINKSFLKQTSYWTKTASTLDTAYVWYVSNTNSNIAVDYANNTLVAGVRPIITILKTNIK